MRWVWTGHCLMVVVDTIDVEAAWDWLKEIAESYDMDELFVANIQPRAPVEAALGVVALFAPSPGSNIREILQAIQEKAARGNDLNVDIFRAERLTREELPNEGTVNLRRISPEGRIRFGGHRYFISARLRGQSVGLVEEDGVLKVYYHQSLFKTVTLHRQEGTV